MPVTSFVDAERVLREVVDDAPVSARSRAPLGDGTVTGFTVSPVGGRSFIAYVDDSHLPVAAETGAVREDGVRVWEHPADPHLPALAAVAFRGAVTDLLTRAGVAVVAGPEMVSYRPGRRAVLRVPTHDGTLWAKVVPPAKAARIVERHTAARRGGLPVPAVRCWSPEGLLVLDAAEGSPATAGRWEPSVLAASVRRLRGRLAASPLALRAAAGVDARADWYLRRLSIGLPAQAASLAALASAVTAGVASVADRTHDPAAGADTAAGSRAGSVVHGDLHIGQLFLDDAGEVSGLIDLDTAGIGDPDQDAAAFLGHTLASASLTSDPASARRLIELARAFHAEEHGPRVHALTAIHLLGHAVTTVDAGDEDTALSLIRAARRVVARGEIADPLGRPPTDPHSTDNALSKRLLTEGFESV